jgi:cystathionine beta-lyase
VPNPELRKKLLKEIAAAGYSQVGLMGLVACQAAYEEGAEWLAQLKAYLEENRKFVKAYLEEHLPEIRLIEPEGTYLLWLDFKALHLNEKELEHLIVDKAHLWLDSGAMFGPDGEGFERINIACPRATVEKALKQLEAAIRG